MPRHPQGLPGHEGLFYDSLPSGKSSYVLCKWALDEQAREQARNGLPVVIGIPGMVLGELDIGPTTGRDHRHRQWRDDPLRRRPA